MSRHAQNKATSKASRSTGNRPSLDHRADDMREPVAIEAVLQDEVPCPAFNAAGFAACRREDEERNAPRRRSTATRDRAASRGGLAHGRVGVGELDWLSKVNPKDFGMKTHCTTADPPRHDDVGDERMLMAEYAIGFDGLRYTYNGYRYDRLADAVAYSKLMRSRPSIQSDHSSSKLLGT